MVATPQPQRDANPDKLELRQLLENSFHNHDLVTLAPGKPGASSQRPRMARGARHDQARDLIDEWR